MDLKYFSVIFAAVFIAELGDKTQLATMLFASDKEVSRWLVFFAASAALIATSAIGVLAGSAISGFVSEKTLSIVAGVGFIIVGLWTIYSVYAG
jgi:putative Ca2+/H+ antiporter (TMEM165/GDT1 family)